MTGVTTIIGVRDKSHFLMPWATKENYLYMKGNWDIEKKYSNKEKEDLLFSAKNAYRTKSEKAKGIGSLVHNWIEGYIKFSMKYGKDTEIISCFKPDGDEVLNCIREFFKWEQSHKVEWLASEMVVASEKHLFAGTLDGLAMVDGKFTLIDLKTSNQIDNGYYIQTAGYQMALEEQKIKPEQRIILRIPKDGKGFESRLVPSDYKSDRDFFINCREIHRANLYYEKIKTNKK